MTVNMNLPMRDEVAARLEADAAAASMSRSAYLQELVMGERQAEPSLAAIGRNVEIDRNTRRSAPRTAPRGGEFSKDEQVGKAKR